MTSYPYFAQACRDEYEKQIPTLSTIEKQRFQEMAGRDKNRNEFGVQHHSPPKVENGHAKKRRTSKGVNEPKGSVSAFLFFCKEERPRVKGLNPELGFGDVAKELGRMWAVMHPEMKRKYEEMAEHDKARYDREMAAYKGMSHTKTKDTNAPKKSMSAFFWFCNDERPRVKRQNPEYRFGEVAKELGRLWSVMNPELKRNYEEMAEHDKARYEREMAAYKKR